MATDAQVRKLRLLLSRGGSLALSARKSGLDEKTARKYRGVQPMPSQRTVTRYYRTRTDPLDEIWRDVRQRLEAEPQLRAVTLFAWLHEQYPGRFGVAAEPLVDWRLVSSNHSAVWSSRTLSCHTVSNWLLHRLSMPGC